MAGKPGTILESRMNPQVVRSSVVITLDREMLRHAGITPEELPDEIVQQYHKGGARDGELVMDLKEAANGD